MTKLEELSDPSSCLSKAFMNELIFVLLERDAATPHAVREWAAKRIELGKNKPDDAQILEAYAFADRLDSEEGIAERDCIALAAKGTTQLSR